MSCPVSERKNSPKIPTGKVVYVIGPRRFQNEAIASCLAREAKAKCFIEENINHIPPAEDPSLCAQPRLVLWDCLGKDLDAILGEYSFYLSQNHSVDHVVIFNVSKDQGIEQKCVLEGIRGFFYEQDTKEIFLKGIHAVVDGELWASREVMTRCILESKDQESLSSDDGPILTQRQIEILAQVAVGATNDEIAEKLCISPHTVKTHLYNTFKKIDVTNRLQAALWAAKHL